jgi:hypothetical protein
MSGFDKAIAEVYERKILPIRPGPALMKTMMKGLLQ